MQPPPLLDMLATPPGQTTPVGIVMQPSDSVQLSLPLRAPLVQFAETERFRELDRLESYYRHRQDLHKVYDWDGFFVGLRNEQPIGPGFEIPYGQRRPSTRYAMARMIVRRLTSMLFGTDRFPELRMPGDGDAEDYVKALCETSRLPVRMIEARLLGGAEGTACLSWAFVNGLPRVEVHNAKHCTVLRWRDEAERVPAAVLKTYSYPRQVWNPEKKRIETVAFYYARYWDEQIERVWEPIPQKLAETEGWSNAPSRTAAHEFGLCPFYWIQNLPDSQELDGESDYEGLLEEFDEVNQLLSAASKGTKVNADPTLVIKMKKPVNEGIVRKGSGRVIWSEGGAEYLELQGNAVKASIEMLERLRQYVLDVVGVVLADPQKLSGLAQSAAALRLLYAPMLAVCDVLREQYGGAIWRILLDMLRAARSLDGRPVTIIDPITGEETVAAFKLALPPRVEVIEVEHEDEEPDEEEKAEGDTPTEKRKRVEREEHVVERAPGKSENLLLNWNPYFPPTWDDILKATQAATTANGGKAIVSQRTTTAAVQSMWGVDDVDQEIAQIEMEGEYALQQAQRAMVSPDAMATPGVQGDDEEKPKPPAEE